MVVFECGIDAPFRGEPVSDLLVVWRKFVFDSGPLRLRLYLWINHPGVLVDFTEKILAID